MAKPLTHASTHSFFTLQRISRSRCTDRASPDERRASEYRKHVSHRHQAPSSHGTQPPAAQTPGPPVASSRPSRLRMRSHEVGGLPVSSAYGSRDVRETRRLSSTGARLQPDAAPSGTTSQVTKMLDERGMATSIRFVRYERKIV